MKIFPLSINKSALFFISEPNGLPPNKRQYSAYLNPTDNESVHSTPARVGKAQSFNSIFIPFNESYAYGISIRFKITG